MNSLHKQLPIAIAAICTFSPLAYAQNSTTSAWDKSMEVIPEFVSLSGSSYTRGGELASSAIAKAGNRRYSLPPGDAFLPRKPGGNGGASIGYSIGCDGVNFGNVINAKMDQFQDAMSAFASNAPAMAVMWIAYSDPTLKAVMDGMDIAANFGLNLSNMNCSAGKQLAQTNNFNDWAEAASVTECENDSSLCNGSGWADKLSETKSDIASSLAGYSKGMLDSARSSSAYKAASNQVNNAGGKVDDLKNALAVASGAPTASCEAVSGLPESSTLRIVLSESELTCRDTEYVAQLLPNYTLNDDLTLTLEESQSLEVTEWYDAMLEDLTEDLQKLRADNREGFKSAFVEFSKKTGLIVTDIEYQKLLQFSVTTYESSASPDKFDAFVSEMAHESTLMIMRSSLRRFHRNFSRSTFGLDGISQEGPMMSLRDAYVNRIQIAADEVDSIESIFNDSAKVKGIISNI